MATAAGYAVGSLSSTRLLARFVARGEDLSTTEYTIDANNTLVSHGVSPSSLGARHGGGWGGLAAVMDIAKAAAVTGVVKSLAPESQRRPEAATASAAAVLGHAYPAFHGGLGGCGPSPILGGALVLDWRSVPVTTGVGWVCGVAIGDALIALEAWPALMVPYAVWREDRALLLWSLAVNAVYWVRMAPEVRQRLQYYRTDRPRWRQRVTEVFQGQF
jgi:glycerol-3-phosphate acyltransferase PlsY